MKIPQEIREIVEGWLDTHDRTDLEEHDRTIMVGEGWRTIMVSPRSCEALERALTEYHEAELAKLREENERLKASPATARGVLWR